MLLCTSHPAHQDDIVLRPLVLQACIKYLLMSDSRNHMLDRFKKEFEGIWPRWELPAAYWPAYCNPPIIFVTVSAPRDFVNYFKERVIPKANRLGKWALGEVNIYDESFFNHAGSPQERFHLRCNQVTSLCPRHPQKLPRACVVSARQPPQSAAILTDGLGRGRPASPSWGPPIPAPAPPAPAPPRPI
jgi:hypothetical protein